MRTIDTVYKRRLNPVKLDISLVSVLDTIIEMISLSSQLNTFYKHR